MKFYATVTTTRVIELDADDLAQAIGAADQQVKELLPESEGWKSKVEVSAVTGSAWPRYYVRVVTSVMYEVRARQLAYQPAEPDNRAGIHDSDPVIRLFSSKEAAHNYADSMNVVQGKLDRQYGRWVKDAVPADIASR